MRKLTRLGFVSKGKKKWLLGVQPERNLGDYHLLDVDSKVELIKALIPVGLMAVADALESEVEELVGARYARTAHGLSRYGHNPSSVRLASQRLYVKVPRVRDVDSGREVSLQSLKRLRGKGEVDNVLYRQVLAGLSCRQYESAARTLPGALGLSPSTVSRRFIEASSESLKALLERDLSLYDITALIMDGKSFAEDQMVVALGVTLEGQKVVLGFVQTATENGKAIQQFLEGLLDRGLRIEQGVLAVIDGSKGLHAAVDAAFKNRVLIQRCQWHKRENVVSYLPKTEQTFWRKRLQVAYNKPTHQEACAALKGIGKELEDRNQSAYASLQEGLEETLTLHRLGVYPLIGLSLKTTNCLESMNALIGARCDKVDHWRNSSQKQRWLASALLDIEPRLRLIRGHKHLPLLRRAIQKELGILTEAKAA